VVGVHGRTPFKSEFQKWEKTLVPPTWVEFGERNFALFNI